MAIVAHNAVVQLPPEAAPIETEILDFFASRNYERSRRFAAGAYDSQILKDFLDAADNPQRSYRTLHVAGTVGKGSITTYLARALRVLGYSTGAYFSPHFVSLRERITMGGEPIAVPDLKRLWHTLKLRAGFEKLSFFDAMTALAFIYFAETNCEYAVIETGLGGRLDSTNNLHADAAILTRIALDHQKILGETLAAIAAEKAGIIHAGQIVFSSSQDTGAAAVIENACNALGATLHIVSDKGETFIEQNQNFARTVIKTLFTPPASTAAAIDAAFCGPIFGRFSELQSVPRVVFDSAHNAAAFTALSALVNRQGEAECNIFLNAMLERDLTGFSALLKQSIQKKINLFLFPMENPQYYKVCPQLQNVSRDEIRQLLTDTNKLHLFTGSMAIYARLRTEFGL